MLSYVFLKIAPIGLIIFTAVATITSEVKIMKKKLLIIVVGVLSAVILFFSADFLYVHLSGVKIDYNNCGVYTKADIDHAAQVVIQKAESFRGEIFFDRAKLYKLKVSDTDCLEYCRSLNEDAGYTESICFSSVMRSPITGGGGWNANRIYKWTWYLARTDNGNWELLTWGYG